MTPRPHRWLALMVLALFSLNLFACETCCASDDGCDQAIPQDHQTCTIQCLSHAPMALPPIGCEPMITPPLQTYMLEPIAFQILLLPHHIFQPPKF